MISAFFSILASTRDPAKCYYKIMDKPLSERRMAENEAVFREYNERAKKAFDEFQRVAKEEGQEGFILDNDTPLHFYCECSDLNCRQRIKLNPSHYNEIHKRRDHFIVICGHDIKAIERVVKETPDYCIIEKFKQPPEAVTAPQL